MERNIYTYVLGQSGHNSEMDDESSSSSVSNPNFTFRNTCFSDSTYFSFIDTNSVDSLKWDFGDTNSGNNIIENLTNPSHLYSDTGSFEVSLIIYKNGNAYSYQQTIRITNYPNADFSINKITQCQDRNNFIFTNKSSFTGSNLNYTWNLGEGNISIAENTSQSYGSSGTFNIKLTVFTEYGCADSIIKSIHVINKTTPVADFTIDDSTQCLKGNLFGFINRSTNSTGSLSYLWYFDDKEISNVKDPSHAYLFPDTFNVKLIASTDYGCSDSVVKKMIVYPQANPAFTVDNTAQCLDGNVFRFTNNSSYIYGGLVSSWDFGNHTHSNLDNPTHSYSAAGNYRVKLSTITDKGCMDTFKKYVHVRPMPATGFIINNSKQCFDEQNFKFINNSTIPYGTLNYKWYLNQKFITDNYIPFPDTLQPDTFYLKLIAESNFHCLDSITKKIVVHPEPEADFKINDAVQCFQDHEFMFTNQTNISSGKTSYSWDMGDNTIKQGTHIKHSYQQVDSYLVKMIATSEHSCLDTAFKYLYVKPMPRANFVINDVQQCQKDNQFKFHNKSRIITGSLSSTWDLDDGTIIDQHNINHTYNASDTFFVKLTVKSEYSCTDSVTKGVIVDPMPVALFRITNPVQCFKNNYFHFSNHSTIDHGTVDYTWLLGDGNVSGLKDVMHSYDRSDTFIVSLIAVSGNNCKDSASEPVIVNPTPEADFIVDSEGQCLENNLFNFTNFSVMEHGTLSSEWKTDDGQTTFSKNLEYSFENDGNYIIWLKVNSENNCSDSVSKRITVYPMPEPKFAFSQACLDQNIYFFDKSEINKPDFLSKWVWNFGNGDGHMSQNPVYIYDKPGVYKLHFSATSNHNCTSDTFMYIRINPHISDPEIRKVSVVENSNVIVEWERPKEGVLVDYILERKTNNGAFEWVGSFDASISAYLDHQVDVSNNRYTYRLRATDSCHHESDNSNKGRNILLKVDNNFEYPVIHWTKYDNWHTEDYNYEILYIDPETMLPQYLAHVNGDQSFFRDSLTKYHTSEYCYQVLAVQNNRMDIASYSNIDCTPTLLSAYVPNAFSPNGDELNDIFRVKGKNMMKLSMSIYNKWGELMFYTDDPTNGWDGVYMNKPAPIDTYKYKINVEGIDGQSKEFIGYFSLVR